MKKQSELNDSNKWIEIKSLIVTVIVAILLSHLLITFVVQIARVQGDSMYPTLHNNQYLIVDKLAWHTFSEINRFDIIVCDSGYDDTKLLIKRVLALPGEKIELSSDGVLKINGTEVDDIHAYYQSGENELSFPINKELGDDEYFVAGDNRNNSMDSRIEIVGNIKKKAILGKVIGKR